MGWALAGQTGGAGDRYPPPRATTPAAGTNAASNSGANSSAASPKSSPASSRPDQNTSPTSGDGLFDTLPPLDLGSRQTVPALNSLGNPASGGPSQSPPAASRSQPNFPGDGSPSKPPATSPKPSDMMQAMLSPPQGSRLRGEPLQLIDAVSTGRTRNEQTQRIEAYWDLGSSVADYYLSLREQEEFRKLGTYVSQPGPAWQRAEKELGVRIDTALSAARAAQFRLAGFVGRGANDLPLPADMPHCGSYTTQYEKIFANRGAPEAEELAGLLSRRYAELNDAAIGVTRAEEWLDDSVQRGGPDGTGGIQALELLALRRRAFVQIARDYNRRIARYTELATPGQIGAERLTSMLIKRPAGSTATRPSSTAPGPNWQSRNGAPLPPRTFAEDSPAGTTAPAGTPANRDRAVQPASGTQTSSPQERSVLVPPQ